MADHRSDSENLVINTPWVTNGASFPPLDPGPSWHVPRVSLPGILGLLPEYPQEWWYYVGALRDDQDCEYSFLCTIVRTRLHAAPEIPLELILGLVGIGWREPGGTGGEGQPVSRYAGGVSVGLGASQVDGLGSLVVPPVSDQAFSITYRPLLSLLMPIPQILGQFPPKDPWVELTGGRMSVAYSGGGVTGAYGSTYAIELAGVGYQTATGTSGTAPVEFGLSADLEDGRGMVMENSSGYVGPSSYECAQPRLTVKPGGSLVVADRSRTIAGGSLWMDRQMVAQATLPRPVTGIPEAGAAIRDAEGLKSMLAGIRASPKPLYTGNWIGFTLDNGLSLVLVVFWSSHANQWISGTKVGSSPSGGFGNVYYPEERQGNGGRRIRPRLSLDQRDDEWDYDVNLLTPEAPDSSPHWTSPITKVTYASAWQIEFSPSLAVEGLPGTLHVRVVCDSCEVVTNINPFYEGAARVCAVDGAGVEVPAGQAFVEQMGYN